MKKNYSINSQIALSILFIFAFNFTALAQSINERHSTYVGDSKKVKAKSVARIASTTQSTQNTTTVTACGSYFWSENGQTYTSTGIYTSGGGITQLFSDQTAWNNAAAASGATVDFDDLSGIPAAGNVTIPIGATTVSFDAPSGIYSDGTFLGTTFATESITITFSPGVYGVSGNFFDTNNADNVVTGNITATYSDSTVDSRTVTTDAETFGYFSTTPITSLTLSTTTVGGVFASLRNLSIATNPASGEVLDLTITPIVTPTFSAVAPICSGSPLSALPTTSNNGINGTWSPALDNTTTTTYTFTPDVGECATTKDITITVYPITTSSSSFTACTSYTWPVNGTTYTTSGAYVASIPLTDTVEINGISPFINHAAAFDSTLYADDLSGVVGTNPTILTFGTTTVTLSAPGGIYTGLDFLGTVNANAPLTIAFNPPVYGVDASYFLTDFNDAIQSGTVSINYNTSAHIQTRTISSDTDPTGYFDSSLISSIVLTTPTSARYISMKNLIIATNPHSCSTETLNLTINNGPVPGDTKATAINVNTPNYTTTGNNLESNCYTDTGGELSPDVWYKVTLDACTLTMSLNTCTGSNFDTILNVYAADGVTLLATSDDDCPDVNSFQSAINNLDVSAEDVVYVMVEGYYGLNTEQGTYGLEISQTLLPQTVPTFTPIAPICNGDSLTLPTTSDNGIPGTWSPIDNTITTTYTFTPNPDQCATTATLTVTVIQPTIPTFSTVAPICNGGSLSALPTTSNNGYTGIWSPALDNTITTTYTFTPTAGQCAASTTLTITVNQPVTPTFNAVADICNGDSLSALPTTSTNNYTGTWSPTLNNTATTTYTFTPTAGQCATTASLNITVNQPITPTFSAIAPICNGDTLSALPTTSNNLFTGTWSPALNNTLTTTYTFTPTPGQCATTASLTITVIQPTTPTFSAVATICNGDTLSALPTTSNNFYTGTWSPALDNTVTTTYTFTPDSGQCATTASLTITVIQPTTPTFTAVTPICNGDTLVALPTTSNNLYTGTWSPALNNTITTTYTFTPTPGQCATTASLTITVIQPTTPTFNAVADICNGGALSALPTTSTNGYTGTWSPALNNTITTIYTFTPTVGQCATTTTLTINVTQPTTPTFNPVADICNGDALSALPTTSNNGYTGTWSPALNNTLTTTYTFTPTPGQCATTSTLTINVTQPTTPTFSAVATICNGEALSALPTTSNNGYAGTWSPALNNTLTTTYTFTPTAGQCATTATLTINVTQPTTPTFSAVATICNGDALSALPTTSNNGYTGSWSPALDNTITTLYTFTPDAGQCATTASLTITVNQPVTPTFTAITPICNGGTLSALPTTSTNGFTGSWSPALDNTTTTTYTFTPDAGQCAAPTTLTITIIQPTIVPTFTAIADICNGGSFVLPATSTNGITGTWSPAIDNTLTTVYTFTPNPGQCGVTTTLTVTVNQPQIPTFDPIAAICNGDALTLPTTSTNGISGTWSPAVNNTATTTYTFTPNVGQCGLSTTLSVTVNQPVTPTFNPVSTICNGDALSALPTTSTNGYTGTWSPALDNIATTTYTFTPDAGQCATTATLTITVTQPTTPTFSPVAAVCNGDVLSALPTISNNGYTGTWSPALNNTITTLYTFTPDAGQCATSASLTITITQPTIPTFTAVTPICNGGGLSALPTTSNNGYTGSWSPALDNTTTTTYTFTPDSGQCAAVTTLVITINQPTTVPTFNAIAPICNGDVLVLPATSTNGITGTWSPAIDNTATTTYTFTPNPGQCGVTATLTVTVNQPQVAVFNTIAAICNGDALTLPTTSTNGISGTWSPTVNNTATTTYTFTPNVGQCGLSTTLSVTVNQPVTPTFDPIATICNGDALSALPTTSTNGYTGTWSPALDNTLTTTYTFTPTPGQCATTATLTINVTQPTTPTFSAVAAVCNGDVLSALPTTSNNGYTGTWSPALDNTITTTYTFTPTVGQCASTASLTITITQPTIPTFTAVTPICNGGTLSALPTTSNNGYTGSWSPALDNTTTTTYTFTPDSGQCAAVTTLVITVNQPTTVPTFTPMAAICNGDTLAPLPTTSTNGITGSWSPAVDNTTTTTYTFTPNPGQCGVPTTMTITVNTTATPTGNATQSFDVADLNDATIANLVVSPTDVNWYASLADALSLNNPLPLTTVLTNGNTYYAVAISATCPSTPFAVTVTVTLGNNHFDDLNFNYYPNPTSSMVNITCSQNITKVTLINIIGQVISTQDTNSTQVQVDLSRLAEATYFIKVATDDREKIIKLVKKR